MSRILENAHEDMKSLHEAGLLNTEDMRSFDAMCLPEVKSFSPAQIKKLRTANNASQAVFALVLNTSVSTVRQWEQGAKKPSGLAMKMLNLVQGKGLEVLMEA
jgi:putative transcriptional regulator